MFQNNNQYNQYKKMNSLKNSEKNVSEITESIQRCTNSLSKM